VAGSGVIAEGRSRGRVEVLAAPRPELTHGAWSAWAVPKPSDIVDGTTARTARQSHVRRVAGAFRVCLDETGHIANVRPIASTDIPQYHADLN
jgi:hypothetical protein